MAGGKKDGRKGQEKIMAAVVTSSAKMLMEALKEEVNMLLGVPKEIDKMRVKLDDLKNFLADADRRNITDLNVQTLVTELRGAMHDATDIIDFCQLKAMDQGPSQDMGCFSPLLFCLRNPLHTHRIGRRIKNLNKKLTDIMARGQLFSFANLASYEDQGRKDTNKATPEGEQPTPAAAAARVQELEVEVTAEKQGAAALKDQFHGHKDEMEVLKKFEESEEAREMHAKEIEDLKKQVEEINARLGQLTTLNKD